MVCWHIWLHLAPEPNNASGESTRPSLRVTASSKQPTKVAQQSFEAPTFSNKKQFANIRTRRLHQSQQRPNFRQKIVKDTIQLLTKQELPVTAKNLIFTTPRTSCIYFKPKIYKSDNPGHPIVSACSCPTELFRQSHDTHS